MKRFSRRPVKIEQALNTSKRLLNGDTSSGSEFELVLDDFSDFKASRNSKDQESPLTENVSKPAAKRSRLGNPPRQTPSKEAKKQTPRTSPATTKNNNRPSTSAAAARSAVSPRPSRSGGSRLLPSLAKRKLKASAPKARNTSTSPKQSREQTPKTLPPPTNTGAAAATTTTTSQQPKTALMTVMQAQELGEQTRFHDDIAWALDGIRSSGSGSSTTFKRDSMASLVEITFNRRGRLALKSSGGGLLEEVLDAVSDCAVRQEDDPFTVLGAAAILFSFSLPDTADPRLLARPAPARLLANLLSPKGERRAILPPPSTNTAAGGGGTIPSTSTLPLPSPWSSEGKILRSLQEGFVARLIPREESNCPLSIALATAITILDPNTGAFDVEPLKHALRNAGAIENLAQAARDYGYSVSDPTPTMETVRALWKLDKCLKVLEHACFACPENEERLVAAIVTSGVAPMMVSMPVPKWLVSLVEALVRQGLTAGMKKDCLRSALAVLMNASQNNAEGSKALVAGGVMAVAPQLLARMLLGDGHRNKGCLNNAAELSAWADELSSCMGLLINLVEHDDDNESRRRKELRDLAMMMKVSGGGGGTTSSSPLKQKEVKFIPLLSGLITVVTAQQAARMAAAAGGGEGEGGSGTAAKRRGAGGGGGGEVTLDTLDIREDVGTGSIIEVYASILLGFLVEGDEAARKEASGELPGGSLECVVSAVERALNFYVSAGAITQGSEQSLRSLVASLK